MLEGSRVAHIVRPRPRNVCTLSHVHGPCYTADDQNAIETGKYDPSLEPAFKIARLFKPRVEDVFKP